MLQTDDQILNRPANKPRNTIVCLFFYLDVYYGLCYDNDKLKEVIISDELMTAIYECTCDGKYIPQLEKFASKREGHVSIEAQKAIKRFVK